MHSPCEITEQPFQIALTIRTRAAVEDLPGVIGRSYAEIAGYLGRLGESPAGAPFVIYYNLDMRDLDVEIGFPVSRELPGQGEIRTGGIPAGTVATCVYTGPYPEMTSAYEALNACIAEKGYEAVGTAIEEYWNGPHEVPPEELKTRIILPLKNK